MKSKAVPILLPFFLLMFFLFSLPKDFIDLGGDSCQYIILAEALSQGKGLRMINHPQEPLCFYYPFIFPLLLLPIIHFFGRNFLLMHFLIFLLGYSSLYILYLLFKKYSDRKNAILYVSFLGLNWIFILYSTRYILSDIPYLFFSSLSLLFAAEYSKKDSFFNKEGFLVLLFLLLSYFTRYIGLSLFLGLISTFLLIKGNRLKKTLFASITLLPISFSWYLFRLISPLPFTSHFKQFFLLDPYAPYKGLLFENPLSIILRFTEGLNHYYKLIGSIFLPRFFKSLLFVNILSFLIFAFLLLGLWTKFKESKSCVFHLYFLFYLIVIIIWPFRGESLRFILPILPFIVFYFFVGLNRFLKFSLKNLSNYFFSFFVAISFVFNILNSVNVLRVCPSEFKMLSSPLKRFLLLHNWIRENLPEKEVIFSRKPAVTYFYTGNKSVVFPYSLKSEEIYNEMINNGVRYIIFDEFSKETYDYLLPFIQKYRDRLKILYHLNKTALFEVLRDQ